MKVYKKVGSRYKEMEPDEIYAATITTLHRAGFPDQAEELTMVLFSTFANQGRVEGERVKNLKRSTREIIDDLS